MAPGSYSVTLRAETGWSQTMTGLERVSKASDGTEGNSGSARPYLSADGRLVAFASDASNLVPRDTTGWTDAFVHDRPSDRIQRVSAYDLDQNDPGIDLGGDRNSSYQDAPSISADGRFVAFTSAAQNFVLEDTNRRDDIFVHDRQLYRIDRVSVADDGTEGNSASGTPSISGDGRFVTFASAASNLVPGDTNASGDIFAYDREHHTIERVSVADDGREGDSASGTPSISADGRFVAFTSAAANLVSDDTNAAVDIFVYDR